MSYGIFTESITITITDTDGQILSPDVKIILEEINRGGITINKNPEINFNDSDDSINFKIIELLSHKLPIEDVPASIIILKAQNGSVEYVIYLINKRLNTIGSELYSDRYQALLKQIEFFRKSQLIVPEIVAMNSDISAHQTRDDNFGFNVYIEKYFGESIDNPSFYSADIDKKEGILRDRALVSFFGDLVRAKCFHPHLKESRILYKKTEKGTYEFRVINFSKNSEKYTDYGSSPLSHFVPHEIPKKTPSDWYKYVELENAVEALRQALKGASDKDKDSAEAAVVKAKNARPALANLSLEQVVSLISDKVDCLLAVDLQDETWDKLYNDFYSEYEQVRFFCMSLYYINEHYKYFFEPTDRGLAGIKPYLKKDSLPRKHIYTWDEFVSGKKGGVLLNNIYERNYYMLYLKHHKVDDKNLKFSPFFNLFIRLHDWRPQMMKDAKQGKLIRAKHSECPQLLLWTVESIWEEIKNETELTQSMVDKFKTSFEEGSFYKFLSQIMGKYKETVIGVRFKMLDVKEKEKKKKKGGGIKLSLTKKRRTFKKRRTNKKNRKRTMNKNTNKSRNLKIKTRRKKKKIIRLN